MLTMHYTPRSFHMEYEITLDRVRVIAGFAAGLAKVLYQSYMGLCICSCWERDKV